MKKKLTLALAGILILGAMTACSAGAEFTEPNFISTENACTVALSAAGGDTASMVSARFVEEKDLAYYEVELISGGQKLTYYVDAVTGVVIDVDDGRKDGAKAAPDQVTDFDTAQSMEPVQEAPKAPEAPKTPEAPEMPEAPKGDEVTDFDTSGSVSTGPPAAEPPAVQTGAAPPQAPQSGTTEITLERAKEIALEHSGKTGANAEFVKAKKELDDGVWLYEIEFIIRTDTGIQEYDYEIGLTGKVLKQDYDAEDYTPQANSSAAKTEDEVRQIALARVPGAQAGDCFLKLERDDGRLIYEGKIVYDWMEYEFEIDAYSGTVLEWEAEPIDD